MRENTLAKVPVFTTEMQVVELKLEESTQVILLIKMVWVLRIFIIVVLFALLRLSWEKVVFSIVTVTREVRKSREYVCREEKIEFATEKE